jgi:hypothetical protein
MKYVESFEVWCCRSMEKLSWTNRVRNEEVIITYIQGGKKYPTYTKTKEDSLDLSHPA